MQNGHLRDGHLRAFAGRAFAGRTELPPMKSCVGEKS